MSFVLLTVVVFMAYATDVDTPLQQVEELLKQHRTMEAIDVLEGYIPKAEDLSRYHFLYAKALERKGDFFEALQQLRLAYIFASGADRERLLIQRGLLYLKMRYYPEAITTFKMFLRVYPGSKLTKEVYFWLAEALRKEGLYDEALRYYDMAGNTVRALYGKANTLQTMGLTKEAYRIYERLLKNASWYLKKSPETRYLLGENLRLMGRLQEAKSYLITIRSSPLRYRAHISLGLIAMKRKFYREATKYFQLALQSPEKKVRRKAMLLLAETYIKLRRTEAAKESLLQIRRLYPYGDDYDRATLLLARLYRLEGNIQGAKKLLKELILRRRPFEGSLEELKKLIEETLKREKKEEFVQLWSEMGYLLLSTSFERFLLSIAPYLRDSEIEFYRLCTWLFNNATGAVQRKAALLLAEFYADLGHPALTLKFLRRSERQGDHYRRLLARAYILEGSYKKALRVLKAVKKLTPEDMELLFYIALSEKTNGETVYRLLNRAGIPVEYYVKAADILYSRGYRTRAVTLYRSALDLKHRERVSEEDRLWAYYMSRVHFRGDGLDGIRPPKSDNVVEKTLQVYAQSEELKGVMQRVFDGFDSIE